MKGRKEEGRKRKGRAKKKVSKAREIGNKKEIKEKRKGKEEESKRNHRGKKEERKRKEKWCNTSHSGKKKGGSIFGLGLLSEQMGIAEISFGVSPISPLACMQLCEKQLQMWTSCTIVGTTFFERNYLTKMFICKYTHRVYMFTSFYIIGIIYIYIYIHMYIYIHICICMYIYIYTCICICIYIYICKYIYIWMRYAVSTVPKELSKQGKLPQWPRSICRICPKCWLFIPGIPSEEHFLLASQTDHRYP